VSSVVRALKEVCKKRPDGFPPGLAAAIFQVLTKPVLR
jgi:hypothetical protein